MSGLRHDIGVASQLLQANSPDLPTQGTPITVQARVTRWRCRNDRCGRQILAGRLPGLAAPFERRTTRLAGIVRLFGHSAGGRPSERLLTELGMPASATTILRCLKRSAAAQTKRVAVRIAGIDEWAWRKGFNYGTIIVDLERRQVVDLLADRSAATSAEWFKAYPEIEAVNRDRAGLYADAVRQGAPQARQIADRFHILKNFRETIERQLGRFEAPIRGAAAPIEDNQPPAAESTVGGSDRASEGATPDDRCATDVTLPVRRYLIKSERSMKLVALSVTLPASWVSVTAALGDGCAASTSQSVTLWRAEAEHPCILRHVPVPQLGCRDDQSQALVLGYPPSWRHRLI